MLSLFANAITTGRQRLGARLFFAGSDETCLPVCDLLHYRYFYGRRGLSGGVFAGTTLPRQDAQCGIAGIRGAISRNSPRPCSARAVIRKDSLGLGLLQLNFPLGCSRGGLSTGSVQVSKH